MRAEWRNPNTLRIIVCGGRDFNDRSMLSYVLWHVHERRGLAEVICGGQRGAEQMASRWAFEHDVRRIEVRAEWRKYGSANALMIRNRQMFDLKPHGLVAFPDGANARTVVQSARERGVPVLYAEAVYSKYMAKLQALEPAISDNPPGASAIHHPWRA
jgi:hypothetical protein